MNVGIALITGANKGIGHEVARQLCERGYRVLVGARDARRGEEASLELRGGGGQAEFVPLDVTSAESVAGAVQTITQRHGVLDVLVNNAAIKLETHPAPPSACSMRAVRETFETNVFGVMAVTLAMLPLLRRSSQPRIVNVSSGLGSLTLSAFPGTKFNLKPMLSYNVAKAAVNAITVQFANELRDSGFKINSADPGYTRTDMTQNQGGKPVARGAAVIVRLATLDKDGPTGAFFDENGPMPW
jgi:NAD(P)-dependent dehydrogenase (short-subunit alcohol dehydrogenase family)